MLLAPDSQYLQKINEADEVKPLICGLCTVCNLVYVKTFNTESELLSESGYLSGDPSL